MKDRIEQLDAGQSYELTDTKVFPLHNSADRRSMMDDCSSRLDEMLFDAQLASRSLRTIVNSFGRKYTFELRCRYRFGQNDEHAIAPCTAIRSVIITREY